MTTAGSRTTSNSDLILVIGGNRGLGAAIAATCAESGAEVVITRRSTASEALHQSVVCDVQDEESVSDVVAEVVDRWGVPRAVIVSPGIAHRDLTMRLSRSTFESVVSTNLTGAFLVAREILPHLVLARRGSLVFVSSVSGLWGTPGLAAYSASKSALIGMARTIAREVGARGVRANVLVPGLLDNAFDLAPGASAWIAATPARRTGTLREAAAVAAFLASDESSGITGSAMCVDGGYAMGLT